MAPGARADLTILACALGAIPSARIHTVAVRGTIVGGRVIHDAF